MADYINKYVDAVGIKHLWEKAESVYMKKDGTKGLSDENFTAEEKEKLASLENYELPSASEDTVGGIMIGDGLAIGEDGKVHTVYNPEMGVDWDSIEDVPTTVEGFGIVDAVTKDELDDITANVKSDVAADIDAAKQEMSDSIDAAKQELNSKIDEAKEEMKEESSKVYKYKGKVATEEDLNLIENQENGDVYDVEETGTNFAWNEDESRWDSLGSVIKIESLSNYELDLITGSASNEEALKALIEEGGDVQLGTNMTVTEPIVVDKDTVLDLNTFKLTGNASNYALVADGAKLTLKGGSIASQGRLAQATNGGEIVLEGGKYDSGNVGFSAIGAGSKVTVEGGTITAQEGGVGAFDGAEVEINGGTITGIDNFPVFTNGTAGRGGNTIVFNNGILEGNITSAGYEACGVYIANNDTFVMNGGKIIANGGCGILMRAGNVTINDGEIVAIKGPHTPGWVGDNKTKMSASAVIYHEKANYPGKAGMSLTINGGTFKGDDLAVEILSNEATPNVTITGGSFDPAL